MRFHSLLAAAALSLPRTAPAQDACQPADSAATRRQLSARYQTFRDGFVTNAPQVWIDALAPGFTLTLFDGKVMPRDWVEEYVRNNATQFRIRALAMVVRDVATVADSAIATVEQTSDREFTDAQGGRHRLEVGARQREAWICLAGQWRLATVKEDSLLYLRRDTGIAARPYLVIGLFFGRIEEGARIFTPARLLPFGHPEAGTHEFPTLQQLHATEFPALVWLGAQAGLHLWATLQRYPTEPADDWPYPDFAPPPDTASLRVALIVHRPRAQSPLPGLRAVLFADRRPVLFLVDTRPLTLAERRMKLATTMGLDLSRADLLAALDRASGAAAPHGLAAVIYDPRPAPSARPKPE